MLEPSVLKTSAVLAGKFHPGESKVILKADLERVTATPTADSIVISRMNTPNLVGECGYVFKDFPNLFLPDRLWMAQAVEDVSAKWLAYLLSSNRFRSQLKAVATGTSGSMKNISRHALLALEVPLPSHEEQLAVAATLSDTDDLIASLGRLIAKKRDIKQGTMQQLLTGRTRLPGYTGKWRSAPLRTLLSYEQPARYLVASTQYSEAGTVPVLTAGKRFVLGYTHETTDVYTDCPVIIFDDFTTSSKFVPFPFKAKSSAMKMLSARDGVDLRFVYERMQLIEFDLGADHKRRWISQYGHITVEVPDVDEQRAIAVVLSDMDTEIEALETRLAKTRNIKQGMMQELLTGRTRLPVSEEGQQLEGADGAKGEAADASEADKAGEVLEAATEAAV